MWEPVEDRLVGWFRWELTRVRLLLPVVSGRRWIVVGADLREQLRLLDVSRRQLRDLVWRWGER